ncbi:cytochrome C peroxidase [Burkholderia pseudomallei]|uniref:cytochrome C peroxidase n=2 Tax=Burkholderia pseudomallei TaxID=28450 RepID=UPI0009B1E165|nr:cytochrome C peroxidase [Burkholderia pseudomallei]
MGEAFRAIGDKSHVENSPRCLLINSKDGHCFIPLSESAGSPRGYANFAALRPILRRFSIDGMQAGSWEIRLIVSVPRALFVFIDHGGNAPAM